ncbi:unnamed protein product, partial [Amoebophrya sp. A25]
HLQEGSAQGGVVLDQVEGAREDRGKGKGGSKISNPSLSNPTAEDNRSASKDGADYPTEA